LDFRNGVADIFEIDTIVTLSRQADDPSKCSRGGRDSEMLR
jgi:hypothetical protein